jgi:hypothetical protein
MKTLEDLRKMQQVYRSNYIFELRECIGKTDDINEPLCQHAKIVAREMANKGVVVCRQCNKPLPEGKPRINDHLILRNAMCVQPICLRCSKENPDEFYRAFKHGCELMETSPLHPGVSRMMVEIMKQTGELS